MGTRVATWHLDWSEAFRDGLSSELNDPLNAWLGEQRWFLAKTAHPAEIVLAQAIPFHAGPDLIWWLILDVTQNGPGKHRYQVPLAWLDDIATVSPTSVIAELDASSTAWLV